MFIPIVSGIVPVHNPHDDRDLLMGVVSNIFFLNGCNKSCFQFISLLYTLVLMILFDVLSTYLFLEIGWHYSVFYGIEALILLVIFGYVCSIWWYRSNPGVLMAASVITGILFIPNVASIINILTACSDVDDKTFGKTLLTSDFLKLS